MTDVAPHILDRKPGEPLSDEDLESLVGQMIDQARDYAEGDLADAREAATNAYFSRKYGNEEEGRSQVVTSEVRDTVQTLLPSLLRTFAGSERAIEYTPQEGDDGRIARQQTDYIRYKFFRQSHGYRILHATFKDALVRKLGIIKWWWETAEAREAYDATGLTDQNLEDLLSDPDTDVEITAFQEPGVDGVPTYSATVRRTRTRGTLHVAACPPEEVAWNRDATGPDDARIIVHSTERRYHELLDMGYDEDDLKDLVGPSELSTDSPEKDARRLDEGAGKMGEEIQDPFTRPIRYDEAYVLLDVDGKGVGLWKLCFAGDEHYLLTKKRVSHRPFAFFCPDPEPHTIEGWCPADDVQDIQRINTAVMRGTLDSLSLALDPRWEAVEGMVNLQDLMNTEIGAIYRSAQPGMLNEIQHRFVGEHTLPFLQYMREIKETRVGVSRLDPDSLQSSTKAAVSEAVAHKQDRLELVARNFAEGGMTDLFAGLLRTVIENQDRTEIIRLRNEYVEVDPRSWNADVDVQVNVGLGIGMLEDKMLFLGQEAERQAAIMERLGPVNPLAGIKQFRNVLARRVEMMGYRNADEFYGEITPQIEQQLAQAASQPPPQDPAAEAIAQAELAKVQLQAARDQAEIQLKRSELALKERDLAMRDDRERDKQAAEIVLGMAEIEAKYSTSLDREQIQAQIARERAQLEADVKLRTARMQADATKGDEE